MPTHLSLLILSVALFLTPQSTSAQQAPIQTGHITYPLQARAAGIEGKVIVRAVIGKDGTVHDVHALSGPPELLQAGVDAVSHWQYKPYTHWGKPVEVNTTVTVNFSLGDSQKKAEAMAEAKAEMAQTLQDQPQP